MTDTDREIWQDAFILYNNNQTLPNTTDAWQAFIQRLCVFAERYDWRNRPLTRFLASAVLDAVDEEVRSAEKRAAARPYQMSFFGEGGAS